MSTRAIRRFLLQVVVDSAAIAAAVIILGFITVPSPFPFGTGRVPIVQADNARIYIVLLSGLGLTIGNIILRPILVAFTGRLIIWSMGLFSVVVTAIIQSVLGTASTGLSVESPSTTLSPPVLRWMTIAN